MNILTATAPPESCTVPGAEPLQINVSAGVRQTLSQVTAFNAARYERAQGLFKYREELTGGAAGSLVKDN